MLGVVFSAIVLIVILLSVISLSVVALEKVGKKGKYTKLEPRLGKYRWIRFYDFCNLNTFTFFVCLFVDPPFISDQCLCYCSDVK